MATKEYIAKLDPILKRRTGCSWTTLCGDEEPIERAIRYEETPEEFADWFIEKHALHELT